MKINLLLEITIFEKRESHLTLIVMEDTELWIESIFLIDWALPEKGNATNVVVSVPCIETSKRTKRTIGGEKRDYNLAFSLFACAFVAFIWLLIFRRMWDFYFLIVFAIQKKPQRIKQSLPIHKK